MGLYQLDLRVSFGGAGHAAARSHTPAPVTCHTSTSPPPNMATRNVKDAGAISGLNVLRILPPLLSRTALIRRFPAKGTFSLSTFFQARSFRYPDFPHLPLRQFVQGWHPLLSTGGEQSTLSVRLHFADGRLYRTLQSTPGCLSQNAARTPHSTVQGSHTVHYPT
jgi:hypothetical protein